MFYNGRASARPSPVPSVKGPQPNFVELVDYGRSCAAAMAEMLERQKLERRTAAKPPPTRGTPRWSTFEADDLCAAIGHAAASVGGQFGATSQAMSMFYLGRTTMRPTLATPPLRSALAQSGSVPQQQEFAKGCALRMGELLERLALPN
jgi:hypothetical protein